MAVRDPSSAKELIEGGPSGDQYPGLWAWVKDGGRRAFVENAGLKLVAFLLALTLFILVHSDEDALEQFTVDLRYLPPPSDLTLVSERPQSITVTLRGSRRKLKRVEESELEKITVTLTNTGEFVFQPEMIRPLPEGIEVVSISPRSVSLQFERSGNKRVPVRVRTVGQLAPGYRVDSIRVEPAQLEIVGAESALSSTAELLTTPVSIDGATQPIRQQVRLEVPPDNVAVVVGSGGEAQPPQQLTVDVNIDIAAAPGMRRLPGTPVVVVGVPGAATSWTTEPTTVELILRGPELTLSKLDPAAIKAEALVSPQDVAARTSRETPLVIRGVPEGVGIEVRPQLVTIKPL